MHIHVGDIMYVLLNKDTLFPACFCIHRYSVHAYYMYLLVYLATCL